MESAFRRRTQEHQSKQTGEIMDYQIQEYSKTAAALADLAEIYGGVVFDVSSPKGMAEAKEGRRELRTLRVDLEKMRVSIKAPALERCRLIDAEAKEISAKLSALEDPIDAQIKAEENREKEAAMAKAIAERQALEAAEAKAKFEREEAERVVREAEQAKIAAERAELEKMRAEQAAREHSARMAIEEAERASRLKIEESERASRIAREAEEAKIKAERESLELAAKKLQEEREATERAAAAKLKAEQEAVEAKEKKAREKKEATEREIRRLENLRLDGKEMLRAFINQYGAMEEFFEVAKSINKFLQEQK
jgi:colicin import membrane protein